MEGGRRGSEGKEKEGWRETRGRGGKGRGTEDEEKKG